MFAAAAPGAGFSETPEFLKVFQSEEVKPTEYEKKLWNLYDCPGYAVNLFNCPTVEFVMSKAEAVGSPYTPAQVHAVLDAQMAYLETIGAIGPATGPGG